MYWTTALSSQLPNRLAFLYASHPPSSAHWLGVVDGFHLEEVWVGSCSLPRFLVVVVGVVPRFLCSNIHLDIFIPLPIIVSPSQSQNIYTIKLQCVSDPNRVVLFKGLV